MKLQKYIFMLIVILAAPIAYAPRPFPQPSINSTFDVIKYVNVVTNNWMTILFCMMAVIIFFLTLNHKGYRASDSLMISFYLTFILSTFLWAAGLLAGKIVVTLLLLALAASLYSVLDSD